MPQALWIFRKDFRRLWGLLAVIAPFQLAGLLPSPSAVQLRVLIGLPQTFALWFLIVALIHEEAVPGNRQYWLTRPFAWKDLLLAKAAFILLFVNLPSFLVDAVGLAMHRQSIVHFIPALLVCEFFLLARVVLPVAAVAAVTATLARFVGCFLALLVGFYLTALPFATHVGAGWDWGGVEWVRSTVVAALTIAMSVAILLVQYARRNTRASLCILAAAPPILAFSYWMPAWNAAFALQARIGPHYVDASAIRLSFDSARSAGTQPDTGASWDAYASRFSVPVLVTGIPAGMVLYSDRATVTVTTSDGQTWTSGWDSLQKLVRGTNGSPGGLVERQFLTAGDECWQYLNIDSSYYPTVRKPVRLHITSAMTLFSRPEVASMARGPGLRSVPGGGSCSNDGAVSCMWPGRAPEAAFARIRSVPAGAFTDFTLRPRGSTSPVANYGPYPYSGGIWQTASREMDNTLPQPSTEIALVSRRAVAHFERALDILVDDSIWRRFVP